MHDSGKRQEFESGAVRDSADGKPRPDLQSPYAQERIGHWLRLGAEKYAERNWEAGMSFSRCVASIERHLLAFKMGKKDEDHLAAIAVNAQFLMHYEAMVKGYVLPASLDDMPHYCHQIAQARESLLDNPVDKPTSCCGAGMGDKSGIPVPQFKAGDKVRIALCSNRPDLPGFQAMYEKTGRVAEYVCKSDHQDYHVVRLTNGCECRDFNHIHTDELTLLVEDN